MMPDIAALMGAMTIAFPEAMNSLKCESYKGNIFVNGNRAGHITFQPLTGDVCKIGYEIIEDARGQGIATAALAVMVKKAWVWKFQTILTGVRSDNFASKAVLFKNGFRVDYITDEADGKYYQCRLDRSWDSDAEKAYWKR